MTRPPWQVRDEFRDRVWALILLVVVFMSGAVLGFALPWLAAR